MGFRLLFFILLNMVFYLISCAQSQNNSRCFFNHLDPVCINMIQLARGLSNYDEVYMLFQNIQFELINREYLTPAQSTPFEPLDLAAACLASKLFPHNAECVPCDQCKLVKHKRYCNIFCPLSTTPSTTVRTSFSITSLFNLGPATYRDTIFPFESSSKPNEGQSIHKAPLVVLGIIFLGFVLGLFVAGLAVVIIWKICKHLF